MPQIHMQTANNMSDGVEAAGIEFGATSEASRIEYDDMRSICDALATDLKNAAGKTIAITGAAGFLGFYLSKTIAHWNLHCDNDDRIGLVMIDTFQRGRPQWIDALSEEPDIAVFTGNVVEQLDSMLADADFIIHAASIASPIFYREHPIETMDANVQGLRNILDFAMIRSKRGRPLDGILYFSTSEIYGDPSENDIPTPETYRGNVSCTGPRACYDESKRYGETLCVNFAHQHQIPVTVARPFNNYGPGLKISDKRAPPDFANDVLNGRDIVLLSDGKPTRTFCYVSDAITGYYKVLFNGVPGESYNIGNDSPEVAVLDFAKMNVDIARELFDYSGEVKFAKSKDADYLTDNPNRRCPDINKARTELGFSPQVSLEEGVRRSLIWYSENQHGDDC